MCMYCRDKLNPQLGLEALRTGERNAEEANLANDADLMAIFDHHANKLEAKISLLHYY